MLSTMRNSAGEHPGIAAPLDPIDPRERRKRVGDAVEKKRHALAIAVNPDQDTFAVIEDLAAEAEVAREAPDRRDEIRRPARARGCGIRVPATGQKRRPPCSCDCHGRYMLLILI